MKILLLILLSMMPLAHASPAESLKQVGSTSVHWLWWKIYDIRLLTASGQYDSSDSPLALVIRYARDIKSTQLVSTTIDEWERQAIHWQSEWKTSLAAIWPDITEGDEIMLSVDDQRHSHFYFNQQYSGVISDPAFTDAFLSIWLSDKSRDPELTRQLTQKRMDSL